MRRKKLDKRLSAILPAICDEKKILAEDLLHEMAFLSKTMQGLKADIQEKGVTELFTQGGNEFERQTPAFQAYLSALGKFGALSAKVANLLPKIDQEQPQAGSLENFLANYDTQQMPTTEQQ